MNILATGDMGFIGTHLKEKLGDIKGYDLKNGFDILDKEKLDLAMSEVDVVIHLAALVSVEHSRQAPDEYVQTNIQGTMNVLEAAVNNGVKRIVYASSAACYEPNSSVYAMTKYASENLMQIYSPIIENVSLRFFNIYGTGQNPAYAAVITAFMKGIEDGEVVIYGDGHQTRDFISVDDICDAIILAAFNEVKSGSVMDIGTGEETSVNQLLKIMSKLYDKPTKIIRASERKEVRNSRADVKVAKKAIKFKANIPLKRGLETMIK